MFDLLGQTSKYEVRLQCSMSLPLLPSPPAPAEDARLRPIRLRTIRLRPAGRNRIGRSRNWPKSNCPKSKLAEVEIGLLSRNWPKKDWPKKNIALQTPPKFHERTPRERKKKENCGGRREKSAKFWASHPSRAPHFVVPKFDIRKLAEVEIGRSRNWPKSIALRQPPTIFSFFRSCFFFFFFLTDGGVRGIVAGKLRTQTSMFDVLLPPSPSRASHYLFFFPFLSVVFFFHAKLRSQTSQFQLRTSKLEF